MQTKKKQYNDFEIRIRDRGNCVFKTIGKKEKVQKELGDFFKLKY
jgi:hypothetical protein